MVHKKFTYTIEYKEKECYIFLRGDFGVTSLGEFISTIERIPATLEKRFICKDLYRIDTAAALYLQKIVHHRICMDAPKQIQQTLSLVKRDNNTPLPHKRELSFLESLGKQITILWCFIIDFLNFIGMLFVKKIALFFNLKNFRYKEILYEVQQGAIKAIPIVALTSFLVGVVVAYQSAVQLKMYGANIFIVDMLGISILRELAPMLTAIVIAGRSGSAYTAEIGAMKITEELDAMRTMGFDPYYFLVIPRIIALSLALPILIFIADLAGVFGGMLIAHSELDISVSLFLERFAESVDVKHFIIGIIKGPFFAFLITTIAIYRGFKVKDDTQSIGKNTTKSVVESIFAVIMCDALFSIIFTNLGL